MASAVQEVGVKKIAVVGGGTMGSGIAQAARSEEHTSELQSPCNLVCRLLLEKKKTHRPAGAIPKRPGSGSSCPSQAPAAHQTLRLRHLSYHPTGSAIVRGCGRVVARVLPMLLAEPASRSQLPASQMARRRPYAVDSRWSMLPLLCLPLCSHVTFSVFICCTPYPLCFLFFFFLMIRRPPRSPLFPYPTLSRSGGPGPPRRCQPAGPRSAAAGRQPPGPGCRRARRCTHRRQRG